MFSVVTEDQEIIDLAKINKIDYFEDISEAIKSSNDIVLTSAYKPKISKETLQKADFINIHYALLPRYRGMHAIVWSILNGEQYIGYTIHKTSHLLDQGPIIFQEAIEIGNMTSWECMLKVDSIIEDKISDIVLNYVNSKYELISQNEDDAIYVAPRNFEDCKINWNEWTIEFFSRALKALVPPYPRPYFSYKNTIISIVSAEFKKINHIEINGRIVYIDDNFVWIKIIDGYLKLKDIEINGMQFKAIDYFNKIGIRLND